MPDICEAFSDDLSYHYFGGWRTKVNVSASVRAHTLPLCLYAPVLSVCFSASVLLSVSLSVPVLFSVSLSVPVLLSASLCACVVVGVSL